MVTSPDAGGSGGASTDMTGLISNCIFTGSTTGGRIYDGTGRTKPFNLLKYSANQILPSSETYISDITPLNDVSGLNNLVMTFADGTSVKKAPTDNSTPRTLPSVGQILGYTIKAPLVGDASGKVSATNLLAFSATTNCVIDGVAQGTDGVIDSAAAPHTLVVGGQSYTVNPERNVAGNISTRLQVGTGTDVLIGGLIIQGTMPKRIAVRGIGPSLAAVGLTGVLADPNIEVHDQSGKIVAENDNWQSSDLRVDLIGTGLVPSHPNEAALIATLDPGNYTVVLQGAGGGTGIGLVEAYDLDGSKSSTLANIATRGKVLAGDQAMIGGFIMLGDNGATNVVIRGIGPSLGKVGVAGALDDPILQVFDGNGQKISENDDWQLGPDAAFVSANHLSPADGKEAAVLLRNPVAGSYTAVVRGKNSGIGVSLVEVYAF
jgi:hypothetical protein